MYVVSIIFCIYFPANNFFLSSFPPHANTNCAFVKLSYFYFSPSCIWDHSLFLLFPKNWNMFRSAAGALERESGARGPSEGGCRLPGVSIGPVAHFAERGAPPSLVFRGASADDPIPGSVFRPLSQGTWSATHIDFLLTFGSLSVTCRGLIRGGAVPVCKLGI